MHPAVKRRDMPDSQQQCMAPKKTCFLLLPKGRKKTRQGQNALHNEDTSTSEGRPNSRREQWADTDVLGFQPHSRAMGIDFQQTCCPRADDLNLHELTDAVSKANINNTGEAETREPNDPLLGLDTLIPARAGDAVTKAASTSGIQHGDTYARDNRQESITRSASSRHGMSYSHVTVISNSSAKARRWTR